MEKKPLTCCDIILTVLYCIFYLFINLCPIIAQINAIHTLCNKDQYLDNPNIFERKRAHFSLMLNGYIIIYLIVYLLYHLISWVVNNWLSENWWKRNIAQTIGGIIVLKIVYELGIIYIDWFSYGINAVYGKESSRCKQIGGYFLLTFLTIGLFLIFRGVQIIINNWTSENWWKRNIAQTIGGLIVLKILYEIGIIYIDWFSYGINAVYEKESSRCKQIGGHFLLAFLTLGLFIIFRIVQLVINNWTSENWWKRNIAQTIGGLIVLKLVYEFIIFLEGIFLYGVSCVYDGGKKLWERIIGYMILIFLTGGLYIPYKIVELMIKNWFSENPWKRHIAQTIGGIVIFKILYEMFRFGKKWVYDEHNISKWYIFLGYIFLVISTLGTYIIYWIIEKMYKLFWWSFEKAFNSNDVLEQIIGRIGLTISTCGLFLIFMFFEYFYKMYYNLQEIPNTKKYLIGVVQCAIVTCGLYGLYHLSRSRNTLCRYTAKSLLSIINIGGYLCIYYYVILSYVSYEYRIYLIISMSMLNYMMMLFVDMIIYSENVRYCLSCLWECVCYCWWGFCHLCDYIAQVPRYCWIKICNGCNRVRASVYACWYRFNQRINLSNHTNYGAIEIDKTEPTYIPTIRELQSVRSFSDKMHERLYSDEANLDKQMDNTLYCISAVIGALKCSLDEHVNRYPKQSDIFWRDRYFRITTDKFVCGNVPTTMSHFSNELYSKIHSNTNGLTHNDKWSIMNEHIQKLKQLKCDINNQNFSALDAYRLDLSSIV
jgi:hypothetical protein